MIDVNRKLPARSAGLFVNSPSDKLDLVQYFFRIVYKACPCVTDTIQ